MLQELNERLTQDSETLAKNMDLDATQLQIAVTVLRQLRDQLGKALSIEQTGC